MVCFRQLTMPLLQHTTSIAISMIKKPMRPRYISTSSVCSTQTHSWNDHKGKSLTKWLPLYRVETVLIKSNYIVRRKGTNHTQCVHRIRLRSIQPQYSVKDLPTINPNNFTLDPITKFFSEHSLFDQ